MLLKFSISIAVIAVVLTGCSSYPSRTTPNAESEPDRVLSRVDDMSSRPSWLHEADPFTIKDGLVTSLGQTTIPADNRVEAAYRIAENSAKGSIASAIEARLDFVFQQAQEGTALDSTQARFIGAEAAKLTTSSIRPGNRYWEKVATTQDNGQRITQYRVFASVLMPETEFKRAVIDAARKAQGKGGLSQDFAQKVETHWDQFVNAPPSGNKQTAK